MLSGLNHLSVDLWLWPWPAQHDTSCAPDPGCYAVYSISSGVGVAERRRWSSRVSVSHTTPHHTAPRRHFRFISGPLDSRTSPQYYSHANWCLDLATDESNKDRDTTTEQKNTRDILTHDNHISTVNTVPYTIKPSHLSIPIRSKCVCTVSLKPCDLPARTQLSNHLSYIYDTRC